MNIILNEEQKKIINSVYLTGSSSLNFLYNNDIDITIYLKKDANVDIIELKNKLKENNNYDIFIYKIEDKNNIILSRDLFIQKENLIYGKEINIDYFSSKNIIYEKSIDIIDNLVKETIDEKIYYNNVFNTDGKSSKFLYLILLNIFYFKNNSYTLTEEQKEQIKKAHLGHITLDSYKYILKELFPNYIFDNETNFNIIRENGKINKINSHIEELRSLDDYTNKIADAMILGEDVEALKLKYKDKLDRKVELRKLINEIELI